VSDTAIKNHAGFIWSVADLLRGVYKQSEYGRVILPLTVLRRLDCVLEPTKDEVLETMADLPATLRNREPLLQQVAGQPFVNMSRHTFHTLLGDPDKVAGNLRNYIAGFSESARDIVNKFNFDVQIDRLDDHNLLYLVVSKFTEIDLSPTAVSNLEMGYLYEELIRRFSELSNETAGEHFTLREVIRLMVNLLFADDDDLLTRPGVVKTLLDPACGTGGMLSVAEEYLRELNPQARLRVFGQEVNAETYATCRADMLIKGADADNIGFGNSFDNDRHQGQRFDYLLANPPFGVEWKMVADTVRDEHAAQGFAGRFGAGLPRINDGSFLFLQHMISKMKRPEEGGARLAIVFNGSPLFTGGAGSGESEIRRWIIENDMLEAVVALPDQLFYNTGISTYFWVLTNRKAPRRRGKVATHRRSRQLHQNAQEPRPEAQGGLGRADRRHHPPLRSFQGRAESQDLPQRVLRVPAHHRGTTPTPALGDHRRHSRCRRDPQGRRQTRSRGAPGPARRAEESQRQRVRLREGSQGDRAGGTHIGHRREPCRPRQGRDRVNRRPRPRGAHHHRPVWQPQARPRPTRPRERPATYGGRNL
jgi:type I restriction enzyme M protein